MSEVVIEKLVQKTSNMLEEVGEVNMLIRRLTPTQETLNRIHERVDAVHGALKQLEKGIQLDEKRLEQLEILCRLLQEEMKIVKAEEEKLVESFDLTAYSLKNDFGKLEASIGELRKLVMQFGTSNESINGRIDQFEQREEKRWASNGQQVAQLIREIRVMRWAGMVLAGLTVVCIIVLALR